MANMNNSKSYNTKHYDNISNTVRIDNEIPTTSKGFSNSSNSLSSKNKSERLSRHVDEPVAKVNMKKLFHPKLVESIANGNFPPLLEDLQFSDLPAEVRDYIQNEHVNCSICKPSLVSESSDEKPLERENLTKDIKKVKAKKNTNIDYCSRREFKTKKEKKTDYQKKPSREKSYQIISNLKRPITQPQVMFVFYKTFKEGKLVRVPIWTYKFGLPKPNWSIFEHDSTSIIYPRRNSRVPHLRIQDSYSHANSIRRMLIKRQKNVKQILKEKKVHNQLLPSCSDTYCEENSSINKQDSSTSNIFQGVNSLLPEKTVNFPLNTDHDTDQNLSINNYIQENQRMLEYQPIAENSQNYHYPEQDSNSEPFDKPSDQEYRSNIENTKPISEKQTVWMEGSNVDYPQLHNCKQGDTMISDQPFNTNMEIEENQHNNDREQMWTNRHYVGEPDNNFQPQQVNSNEFEINFLNSPETRIPLWINPNINEHIAHQTKATEDYWNEFIGNNPNLSESRLPSWTHPNIFAKDIMNFQQLQETISHSNFRKSKENIPELLEIVTPIWMQSKMPIKQQQMLSTLKLKYDSHSTENFQKFLENSPIWKYKNDSNNPENDFEQQHYTPSWHPSYYNNIFERKVLPETNLLHTNPPFSQQQIDNNFRQGFFENLYFSEKFSGFDRVNVSENDRNKHNSEIYETFTESLPVWQEPYKVKLQQQQLASRYKAVSFDKSKEKKHSESSPIQENINGIDKQIWNFQQPNNNNYQMDTDDHTMASLYQSGINTKNIQNIEKVQNQEYSDLLGDVADFVDRSKGSFEGEIPVFLNLLKSVYGEISLNHRIPYKVHGTSVRQSFHNLVPDNRGMFTSNNCQYIPWQSSKLENIVFPISTQENTEIHERRLRNNNGNIDLLTRLHKASWENKKMPTAKKARKKHTKLCARCGAHKNKIHRNKVEKMATIFEESQEELDLEQAFSSNRKQQNEFEKRGIENNHFRDSSYYKEFPSLSESKHLKKRTRG